MKITDDDDDDIAHKKSQTLFSVVQIIQMFPVEVLNKSEDGIVVGWANVDGERPATQVWTPQRGRRTCRGHVTLSGGPRRLAGRGGWRNGGLDGAWDDDRHLERACEGLHRRNGYVTSDSQHSEYSARHRQALCNVTKHAH